VGLDLILVGFADEHESVWQDIERKLVLLLMDWRSVQMQQEVDGSWEPATMKNTGGLMKVYFTF